MDTTTITRSASGRKCVCCLHTSRAEIEHVAVSGEMSIRGIARQWGLQPESVRRHFRNHVDASVREALSEGVPGFSAISIAARIFDTANRAAEIASDAINAGNDALALRAGSSEVAALLVLSDRLGVTKDDAMDALHETDDFLRALIGVMREHPTVAKMLADEFRDRVDRPDLALLLETRFPSNREEQLGG